MQDGKHSLWNPVCLPELPDCYLFPKEIKTFSFAALFFLFLGRPELFDTRRHFCLRRPLNGSRLDLGDRRDFQFVYCRDLRKPSYRRVKAVTLRCGRSCAKGVLNIFLLRVCNVFEGARTILSFRTVIGFGIGCAHFCGSQLFS